MLIPSVAQTSEVDHLNLTLPVLGDHTLHVLAPTVLELVRINSKPSIAAPVDSWDFVDAGGVFHAPAISQFAVTVDGAPATVTAVGFKRRPFYAPLFVRDLRIENSLYLQLSAAIADGQVVEVKNPGGTLWISAETYVATATPLRYSPAIHVNQEGYVPGLPKKAMIGCYLGNLGELNVSSTLGFKIVAAGTGTLIFQGTLTVRADVGYLNTPTPYQKVLEADFSGVTAPGKYQLVVPGLGASLPFVIDEGVAMNFLRTYALGLYEQRCGTDNVMPFTRFVHEACHVAAAEVPSPQSSFSFTWSTIAGKNGDFATNPRHTAPQLTSEASQRYPFVNLGTIDVVGGHHDAGDYSKYTINSAALAHLLMFTADAIPGAGTLDNLGLPQSSDGISDILQEAKLETDYLAKLQDADGGFYFIVYPKTREYESNVLPDYGDTQVVWPKNTAASAAAVAALAQAASSPKFKAAYPTVAALYLKKAKLGWQFLLHAIATHGKDGSYQKITFYGDNYMHDDELAWAACELFVATGEAQYQQKLYEWFPNPGDSATFRWGWWRMSESWGNAIRSYAFAVRTGRLQANQLDAAYLAKCEAQIVAAGDDALRWSNQNAYATSFPEETKHVLSAGWYFSLDQAADMATAYQITPKASYLDALVGNLNYEAGTNPVNVSYLTGLGQKRQREIVSQYALNDRRVLPPSGIPLGNIQTTFPFLDPYGAELSELVFPSDGAVAAPYEFYDRWADTFNVTTEYIAVNQARSLLALSVLATRTTTQTQVWKSGAAQITTPTVALLNAPVTLSVQAPGFDLASARIVWEARDQEPAFGSSYTISPKNNGPQWTEAEITLPDGRRLFAINSFNANSTTVNWVDGAVPAGGAQSGFGGDAWTWLTPSPAAPSGHVAHQSNLTAGEHGHLFENATATVQVGIGDEMFAWVYLDPLNPPTEVMLTWNNPTTEHRAYWGANTITWGNNNSPGRYPAGALPPIGQWVRLSVPASAVGLEGSTVSGMAFVLVDGRATWDTAGIATAVQPATAPAITTQPQPQTTTIGAGASFTVSATGTAPLAYLWSRNGVSLTGATTATLALSNAQPANAGSYAVVVSNAVGNTPSSAASLTVNPAPGAPSISTQPQTQTVAVGANATLTVSASGNAPLAYQWKRNGVVIASATSTSFTFTAAAPGRDSGWYQAVITNASGSATSAAAFITVAITPTQIVGWGRNVEGETTVPGGLTDAVALATGGAHSTALRANGTVLAWGRNSEGQTNVPAGLNTVVALAAGLAHTLALKADGTLIAWGANTFNQTAIPGGLGGVVSIAAGNYHSVALKGDGTVLAWGDNGSGQSTVPAGLANVIAIAAGGAHTLALKSDGTIVAWGYNGAGQSTVPNAATSVVGIAAGYFHTVALKSDSTPLAWGWNGYGQAALPVGLVAIAGIAAGGTHTLAQRTDGTVIASGDNTFGQSTVPVGLTQVFRIAAGGDHSLALRDARVLPVITTQPVSQSVIAGQPVTFSVVATGTPAPTLQWRNGGTAITGATNASYTIAAAVVADAGNFDVVATNSAGDVPSMIAILTVGKATPTITWATPATIVYGVALSATQLNATASAPGAFVYAPLAGTVLGAGAGQTLSVTFTPTDNANINTATAATTLTVSPNFAWWKQSRFTSAELADATKSGPTAVYGLDGISNLVKYALGLEPKVNAIAGLPAMTTNVTDWIYTYARPAGIDIAYTAEISTNLSTWTTAGALHEFVSTSAGGDTWRARYLRSSAANIYFRLKVTQPNATDTAYTLPLGGNTITIAGASSGVPKITTFTSALRLPVAGSFVGRARGTLTAVAANAFTDSQAGWLAGALSQPAAPYFVRIRSGAAAGNWWQISTSTANSSTNLTILSRGLSPASLGLAPGDVYEIVPGDTLNNLLGPLAAAAGGVSASVADAVRVHDGVNWREYYYSSTASQWREGAATFDRGNTVIRPDTGVAFVRRGAGDLTLLELGAVSDASETVLVNPTGVTVIGSVFPIVRTLGSLNVQSLPGFINYTGDLAAADKVTIQDGVNWRSFQYDLAAAQWREGTSTFNRNSFTLPFSAPFILERGTAAAGSAVPFILPIPYTL